MDKSERQPIAQEAYDALAESYARLVDTKPHNTYYERPATLSLLPDVRGKRVLDAGCGPGVYTEWLVDQGAEVVALDANAKMVRLARERLRGHADVRQADLNQTLGFLPDASFDLVLGAFGARLCGRLALRLRGVLPRATGWGNPWSFRRSTPFQSSRIIERGATTSMWNACEYEWTGFGPHVRVPSYRRPLSAMIQPLLEAGFTLERILEPIPTEEFRRQAPTHYAELIRSPGFICVRASKRG